MEQLTSTCLYLMFCVIATPSTVSAVETCNNCLYEYDLSGGSVLTVQHGNVPDFDATAGPMTVFDRQLTTFTSHGGLVESKFVAIQFWKSPEFTPNASSNTEQYFTRDFRPETIQKAQDDIVSVFGNVFPHSDFVTSGVDIFTFLDFAHGDGDETTPANTVQVVLIYGTVATLFGSTSHSYVMLNYDSIGWWEQNGNYPQIGLVYFLDSNKTQAVSYSIPGSGSADIEKILPLGNSGMAGRWMFHASVCTTAACLGARGAATIEGAVSPASQPSYKSYCKEGYTGDMCIYDNASPIDTPQCNISAVDICSLNLCKNGTCMGSGSDFYCECDSFFTGLLCDVRNETSSCSGVARVQPIGDKAGLLAFPLVAFLVRIMTSPTDK